MSNFPCYEKGQVISATTISAVVPLAGSTGRLRAASDMLLWNPGPNMAHVLACTDTGNADTTCAPVPPGALWVYAKGGHTHLAVISVGGPQDLIAIVAEGA